MNTSKRKIPPRFVVPPPISPGQELHMVKHKKFPQKLTITQKRIMQRQRAMEKRQLNEVPKEALEKKTKESEKLKEEAMSSPEKTKFGRRDIKDAKSICNSDKETDSIIILIGTIPISLNCSTNFLTFPAFFKSKEMEKCLIEVKEKQPTIDGGCMYKGVTIEPSTGSRPHDVILEKPIMEMTKTYVMSNLQGEPHQRFIDWKYLKQYFSTMWEMLGIT